jgi:hypothetical protein
VFALRVDSRSPYTHTSASSSYSMLDLVRVGRDIRGISPSSNWSYISAARSINCSRAFSS